VLADLDSAKERGLSESDIVEGIRLVDSSTISSTAANSERTVIF
jgi:predicted peroxiredoxin